VGLIFFADFAGSDLGFGIPATGLFREVTHA
jgi:hypothetical protein